MPVTDRVSPVARKRFRADDVADEPDVRIGELLLRSPSDDDLAPVVPDDRRVRQALGRAIGERGGALALDERDQAVRCSEVEAYSCSHVSCSSIASRATSSFSLATWWRGGSTSRASVAVPSRPVSRPLRNARTADRVRIEVVGNLRRAYVALTDAEATELRAPSRKRV